MYIAVTNRTGTQASIECFKQMKSNEVKVTQNLISSLPSASDTTVQVMLKFINPFRR